MCLTTPAQAPAFPTSFDGRAFATPTIALRTIPARYGIIDAAVAVRANADALQRWVREEIRQQPQLVAAVVIGDSL